jgi:intron-binding protein aquarius
MIKGLGRSSLNASYNGLLYIYLFSFDELRELAGYIHLVDNVKEDDISLQFLLEALVFRYERRVSQIKRLNAMALYPTEEVIWDENVVPSDYHSASGQVLALPKLNLQFLTLHDYLLRNFDLFRLESTCKCIEIFILVSRSFIHLFIFFILLFYI